MSFIVILSPPSGSSSRASSWNLTITLFLCHSIYCNPSPLAFASNSAMLYRGMHY